MQEKTGYGRWIAGKRSKWVTLFLWIMVIVVLTIIWPGVNTEEINNAPNLSSSKLSIQADQITNREFPSGADAPALLVWHRQGGIKDEDLTHLQKIVEALDQSPLPQQTSIPPLHKLPLEALKTELSEDQSTLITPVFFSTKADVEQLKTSIDQLKKQIEAEFGSDIFAVSTDSPNDLSARVTGPVGIQIDATGLFMNADVSLLLATVMLVLVILLLIYRSPILALIPLVAVGFAYGIISPLLGIMAHKGWITVDAQAISIMTVLLFGAGTDYCLFLIARFRQFLVIEADKGKALLLAVTGSSGAIAMSGVTVVLALLALLFAEFGAYYRFAAPFSIAILVMGAASLTLVPALLAIFGRVSFYPFIPRTPEMQTARALKKGKPAASAKQLSVDRKYFAKNWIGKLVTRKPKTIVWVTVILLGGLALCSTQIKFTFDILSSFPENMASREGFKTIGEQFTPGQLAPVKVIVDTQGKDTQIADKLSELPYVDNVSAPEAGKDTNIKAYNIELSMNPYSMEAMEHIPDIRAAAEESLVKAGVASPGEKVWVSGQTATQYDSKTTTDRDTLVIIPIVIIMIALLLFVYLRSVVAMAYLVVTVILSYFSALGLGWLVVHYGLGAEAIQGAIPLYSFVFLVALGEDYNIFMISSIWQKRKVMPLKQAIREGVGETSSVITSAGLILAGTFAVLASLPIQVLVQFGLITAIGILLDTFIVRPFLVPAITVLLGRWAFWPGAYIPVEELHEPDGSLESQG